MKRRDFMVHAGVAWVWMSAYGFGESIAKQLGANRKRVALLYGTRYGATRETAEWIAKGVGGDIDLIDVVSMDGAEVIRRYDQFIIGSGIWIDGPHKRLLAFLMAYREQVEAKIIASFVICGTTGENEAGKQRIAGYFERMHTPLQKTPLLMQHFGGRMIIEDLTNKDRKLLENFYRNVLKREFVSWDRTQPEAAKAFGNRANEALILV